MISTVEVGMSLIPKENSGKGPRFSSHKSSYLRSQFSIEWCQLDLTQFGCGSFVFHCIKVGYSLMKLVAIFGVSSAHMEP